MVSIPVLFAPACEKYGIDFCCGGQATLAAICQEKDLDLTKNLQEIEIIGKEPVGRSENFAAWSLPFLIDYIVNTHHAYLKENDEQIVAYARKIAEVHGAHHPEVIEIAAIFAKIADDMAVHLKAEEEVFFPAVKRVDSAVGSGQYLSLLPPRTLLVRPQTELRVMTENQHDDWNPLEASILENQRQAYDKMREHCPVAYSKFMGWSLFRHEDIRAVLADPETFSNASHFLAIPNGMDPPAHGRYHDALAAFFNEEKLTDEQIVSILRNWAAGHGTVSAALGILILHLARNPELQNQLRNDPSLIPPAIEEILRVDGPLVANRRTTTREVEIQGRTIPSNTAIQQR